MNILVAEIEQSRKALGLNQDDIADIMGIQSSKTFRSRMKSPDTFSLEEIKKYASYIILNKLDIQSYPTITRYSDNMIRIDLKGINEYFDEHESLHSSSSSNKFSPKMDEMVRWFGILDKDDQKRIYNEIKSLADKKLDLSHL